MTEPGVPPSIGGLEGGGVMEEPPSPDMGEPPECDEERCDGLDKPL